MGITSVRLLLLQRSHLSHIDQPHRHAELGSASFMHGVLRYKDPDHKVATSYLKILTHLVKQA